MSPSTLSAPALRDPEAAEYEFFVSTTGCAGDLRRHLGSADYSYGFVLRALAPALEALGSWRLIDRPESRLPYLAARSRAEGRRPVHLVLHPAHHANFVPGVPNVLFPFWEFPRIPDRDFGHETRQNWARMSRGADLIVCACELTAHAFRDAGVPCPVEVVPVPVDPSAFDVPAWDPARSWSVTGRNLVLDASASTPPPPFGAIPVDAPWLLRARHRFNCEAQRWLNDRAFRRVQSLKRRVLRRPEPRPPLLPGSELTISGLTYLSIFNPSDLRKNLDDLITAFLRAFHDRADVSFVLKLATSKVAESKDVAAIRKIRAKFGAGCKPRLVLLTEYLDDAQMLELVGASTFYVNASRAEGACLPLQQALAAGRPAIAPAHTSMADYVRADSTFLVGSDPEPTHWPHDPEARIETVWHRISWSDLRDRFVESARLVESDRAAYDRMAAAARASMADYAHPGPIARRLRRALARLEG
jgi:glycosyltransferase involved in cell wall biosynthesis